MRAIAGLAAAALIATASAVAAEARPPSSVAQSTPASPAQRLGADMPRLLADQKIASVSIATLEHGRVAYVGAWGEAAPGRAATPETLYNVASLTKPITAEVAMRLAPGGRISLDESMAAYWTDPDLADDPRVELLTPRVVMSHRSGFPNWRWEEGGVLRFRNTPGTTFGYSGEGFEWLARFIEHKLDTPFETLAQTLVFAPAGMTDTAYTRRAWFEGRLAAPYGPDLTPLTPQIADRYLASDDLVTTPGDYARFLAGVAEGRGVTPALMQERMRLQTRGLGEVCPTTDTPGCPQEQGFGLGWETILIDGRRFLMHTGMDEGTFTFAYIEPEADRGLVLFTNSGAGWKTVLPVLETVETDPAFVAYLRKAAS